VAGGADRLDRIAQGAAPGGRRRHAQSRRESTGASSKRNERRDGAGRGGDKGNLKPFPRNPTHNLSCLRTAVQEASEHGLFQRVGQLQPPQQLLGGSGLWWSWCVCARARALRITAQARDETCVCVCVHSMRAGTEEVGRRGPEWLGAQLEGPRPACLWNARR
jgi:hypothetical protein